ncbi:TPA: DUF4222 domain-containing protein [Escherichia coli]|jgi:hypothetical protein|nr:DUF4222 domain-containing protein [Escherichia coli]HAY5064661.1 DUF4222 domain-containing protein [Escherichia coli]HCD7314984.1 DUF4222 domain-containing protein [Enterobacter chengduensis]HCH6697186.1 DUF4222 domain-containing protein [Enterobacter chengduensis]
MKKKNTGLIASGLSQPEIRQGDKWRDGWGDIVTVESYRFNRVTFIRDGYLSPCTLNESRFIKEFNPVGEVTP